MPTIALPVMGKGLVYVKTGIKATQRGARFPPNPKGMGFHLVKWMKQVTFKGTPIQLTGKIPPLQTKAPDFSLTDADLRDHSLSEFQGSQKILATVPSLDTSTCSLMGRHLNEFAKTHPKTQVILVSADLPFAQKRFCEAEGVKNLRILSMMRNKDFGKAYGLLIQDSPLAGLLARSIFILNEQNQILHIELAEEVTKEPDYQNALKLFQ